MSNPATQFKKGNNANPKGRPKMPWTMRGEILKALERRTLDGTPMRQGVAESLVDKALQGDVVAIKEINNRADGMATQAVDVTSLGEKIEGVVLYRPVKEEDPS